MPISQTETFLGEADGIFYNAHILRFVDAELKRLFGALKELAHSVGEDNKKLFGGDHLCMTRRAVHIKGTTTEKSWINI